MPIRKKGTTIANLLFIKMHYIVMGLKSNFKKLNII